MYNEKAKKRYEEGRIHYQNGNLTAAERAYKKAIRINQNFAEAHNNLGNVLLDQGRYKEAFNAYRKALKLIPDHPMLLNNIGNVLLLQGEYEKALSWLNKAIAQNPDYADAQSNLGNTLWSLGKEVEAVAALKRAIELNPDLVDSYNSLGGVLIQLDRLDEAVNCFDRALSINPAEKKAYQGLARARKKQGDFEQAISAYQKAIAIDPANEAYYQELGKTFSDYGETEKAVAAYRKAIEINPEQTHLYQSLSRNKVFQENDEDIAAMESLRATKGISDRQSMDLAFALSKAYEDLGKFEKSMELTIEAARLKRSMIDYSISQSREQFSKIKELFSPEFFASRVAVGDPDSTPIFILGMPRSGTSLVEQILASHPDVFGAGELKDLAEVEAAAQEPDAAESTGNIPSGLEGREARSYADFGKEYIKRIRKHSIDARFITDKMPHNFLRIGFIRVILPNAKIIHCTRDPMDNCLSIFKTYLPRGHHYSFDMTELGQYYKLYLELMEYWRETLPGYIYDQSYEELVSRQEDQVRALLQYCDLPWNDACLDFYQTQRKVSTASSAQVRRPIYQDSVNRWKRYEMQLEPLKTAIYG